MALVSLFRAAAPGRHAARDDDAAVEDAGDVLAELGFRYADD